MKRIILSICSFLRNKINDYIHSELRRFIRKIINKEIISKKEQQYFDALGKVYNENIPNVSIKYDSKNKILFFESSLPVSVNLKSDEELLIQAGINVTKK